MNIKALKGFKDILPGEVDSWQLLERRARGLLERFGCREIRVPILEKTELFARSIGAATDIVEKEMYTFTDRNGDSITMRPEGTASVIRAFIENGMHVLQPVSRLYTIGPMFRHERPQKGRLRQFHQMSVEIIGSDHPGIDAELMAMAWLLVKELGLAVSLEINSLGCAACRPRFKQELVAFLADRAGQLCPDCERRRESNPLRVLDCKSQHCQEQYKNAPIILDYLCPACREHFEAVKQKLDLLSMPYKVNSSMVRGLDYYTRTTFELLTGDLGAQGAVGAGGRYDGLVRQLGGPDLPGIGFAMGLERLVLLLDRQEDVPGQGSRMLFVAALGENARNKGFELVHSLRMKGLQVVMDHNGRSLKSQMKQAGRFNAAYVLILGEDELVGGEGILRNMESGEQTPVPLSEDLDKVCVGIKQIIA